MPDSVWIKYAESLNCVFEKKILPLNFSKKSISHETEALCFTNCPSHINVPQKFLANLKMSYIFQSHIPAKISIRQPHAKNKIA